MIKGEQIEFSLPERLNLGSYYLDVNLEAGRGDKTAIYYKDRTYSFLDLWRLTNRVGNVFKGLGVEPENRIVDSRRFPRMGRRLARGYEDWRGGHPRLHLSDAA